MSISEAVKSATETDVTPKPKLRQFMQTVSPTGRESPFGENEIIVTKTDRKGRIKYANDVFLRVACMDADEAFMAPHSIIRHPEMPRAVFKLLWDEIEAGKEVFAYVNNLAKNGDNYWVFAHVTPSFDANGHIIGYHSSRRRAGVEPVRAVNSIYSEMLKIEANAANKSLALSDSSRFLAEKLKSADMTYDQFVFSI